MAARVLRGRKGIEPSDQSRRLGDAIRQLAARVERQAAEIEKLRDEYRIQVKRSGELQAELDVVKKAVARLTGV